MTLFHADDLIFYSLLYLFIYILLLFLIFVQKNKSISFEKKSISINVKNNCLDNKVALHVLFFV